VELFKTITGTLKSDIKKTGRPVDDETKNYFKRLKKRLVASLILATLVPFVILSVYFHIQFNTTLKHNGELHLISLAESLRNTIDLFLHERVVNIFNLFHSSWFNLIPTQEEMDKYLMRLMQLSDAFVDVGFMDPSGIQIGYAGPYPYLRGENYSNEMWFKTLQEKKENFYISDIYMGLRRKPHFTIAVKQMVDEKPYVIRATLDPDKFYLFLRSIGKGKSAESSIINKEGKYQIVDPLRGSLEGDSKIQPPVSEGSGVMDVEAEGGTDLVACAWLTEVPWFLIVQQPLIVAYSEMYHARRIIIFVSLIMILIISAAIWVSTDRLLGRAEATEESRKQLQSQLFHAAKLVSVGELAAGVAHEINNPLAIILSQCGVIRDLFDPELGGDDSSPKTAENVREEVLVIEESVFRARDITQKLLKSSRKSEPKLVKSNMNRIIEDVVGGLIEKELEVANIELVRNYDPNLPDAMVDPDQIRQVIQNLINNATDAIEGSGKITVTTRVEDKKVKVIVSDTGKGISPENMGKIFLPFFTTKEAGKGTGLGLGISLSIVEGMGGGIDVQSIQGSGSAFTVSLPLINEGA
jgi:two-component system, NtrC family, sensor kinase